VQGHASKDLIRLFPRGCIHGFPTLCTGLNDNFSISYSSCPPVILRLKSASNRKDDVHLRHFAWSLFQSTGNIEAYLLYKDLEDKRNGTSDEVNDGDEEEETG
jgi:YqzL-like protein